MSASLRCVGMYRQTGMYSGPLEYNFVMGVASGMPADPELLPILLKLKMPEAHWQSPRSAAAEIWPLHQRCADLGGHLRSGLEDTFYLGDGTKVTSNGQLVDGSPPARARRARDREPGGSAGDFLESDIDRHPGHAKREPGISCNDLWIPGWMLRIAPE